MNDRQLTGAMPNRLKVERQNLAQKTAVQLREAIVRGDFAPDTRLTEVDLASQLSVSRGTLRTALAQLESEGFVTCERYSAWRVASLGSHEIWESYTFRAALESMAARLTAARINDTVRVDLERHLQNLSTSKKPSARVEADLALHLCIVRHARHKQLIEVYQRTLDRFRWIYSLSESQKPERINLFDWHEPLVEAICAGEAHKAGQIAHDMIMASMSDDLELYAARDEDAAFA